jgi:hypothetical protein
MSIKLIVTRGFGNGTFEGTITKVVLRGYTIGAAIVPVQPSGSVGSNRTLSFKSLNRSQTTKNLNRKLTFR